MQRDEQSWIQTFSGRKFWPLDPRADELDIEDIAHALSQICRFTGHTKFAYSVAQHSILVSQIVPSSMALEGLLHDAAEAYVADIARPVKRSLMHVFGPIEERLDRCVAERFELVYPWPAEVKHADNVLLATERRDVMQGSQPWKSIDGAYEPMADRITRWSSANAKVLFMNRYHALVKERSTAEAVA